jgi:hypothetical protein
MRRLVLWIVDHIDRGECRWCGAPPEEGHMDCWLEWTDAIREWAQPESPA